MNKFQLHSKGQQSYFQTNRHTQIYTHTHTHTSTFLYSQQFLTSIFPMLQNSTKQGNTMDTSGTREQQRSLSILLTRFFYDNNRYSVQQNVVVRIRMFEVVSCFPLLQCLTDHAFATKMIVCNFQQFTLCLTIRKHSAAQK